MKDDFYSLETIIRMYERFWGFKDLMLELLANEENQ